MLFDIAQININLLFYIIEVITTSDTLLHYRSGSTFHCVNNTYNLNLAPLGQCSKYISRN